MSVAKIPLVAMHQYTDGQIWKDAVFPEGFDRNLFINQVLLEYGEMETLYADPQFMQFAIAHWSETNYWGIDRAVKAISVEYAPLENYNRIETRTREYEDESEENNTGNQGVIETTQGQIRNTGTVQDHGTNTGTVTDAKTVTTDNATDVTTTTSGTNAIDETVEHKVSAYDASTYSPSSQDSTDRDESSSGSAHTVTDFDGSETTATTRTDNLANSNTREDNLTRMEDTTVSHNRTDNLKDTKTGSGSESESILAHGNIGVMSSQQMLREELGIAMYNIYETYAGVFATNLLLMVY